MVKLETIAIKDHAFMKCTLVHQCRCQKMSVNCNFSQGLFLFLKICGLITDYSWCIEDFS